MGAKCHEGEASPKTDTALEATIFRTSNYFSYHYLSLIYHLTLALARLQNQGIGFKMGKRANKRQKTVKAAATKIQPLGIRNEAALQDDASKDEEERRLESMLFGTKYVPVPVNEHVLVVSDDEEELGAPDGKTEFQTVMDTDVSNIKATQLLYLSYIGIAVLCRRCYWPRVYGPARI